MHDPLSRTGTASPARNKLYQVVGSDGCPSACPIDCCNRVIEEIPSLQYFRLTTSRPYNVLAPKHPTVLVVTESFWYTMFNTITPECLVAIHGHWIGLLYTLFFYRTPVRSHRWVQLTQDYGTEIHTLRAMIHLAPMYVVCRLARTCGLPYAGASFDAEEN